MPHQSPQNLFPVIHRHVWLNHAAISAWPTPVIEALRGFVEENANHGSSRYELWLESEQALRQAIADLITAPQAEDITLVRNTSEAINIVAQGIPWADGDEVLVLSNEFPSNLLPWINLKDRGVIVRLLTKHNQDPTELLISEISNKTRMVAVSSVQYDTGFRLDLARLGAKCQRHNALLCVDAIQELGAMKMDVSLLPIDFLLCGSHKWLMSPEGMGFLWSRADVRQTMHVALPGWRMYEDPFNFIRSDWTPPASGHRFETGTINMFGVHGLLAAMRLLNQLGPSNTERQLIERSDCVIDCLKKNPRVKLITPTDPNYRAGIISFTLDGLDPERLVQTLEPLGIYIAHRAGAIRISPHFYTPIDQIERAVASLEDPDVTRHCSA